MAIAFDTKEIWVNTNMDEVAEMDIGILRYSYCNETNEKRGARKCQNY